MTQNELDQALKTLRKQFLTKRTARLDAINALIEGAVTYEVDGRDLPITEVPDAVELIVDWLRSSDLECMDRGVQWMDAKLVKERARKLEAKAGHKLRWGPKVMAAML